MPRFYFNVRDGIPIINDRTGIELPGLPAAVEEAHREAALVSSAMRNQPDLVKEMSVQVCDKEGKILARIDLPDTREFRT
ncbi:hypothetical protein IHQ71_31635 (plasmid) [Rhizobium sp. TH2]|uniref:DUF6894 family protein n=1 Tax=Rhizobium sp. TH2 TaxID=2775403 RepID=UPI0021580E18|nr:hypothetical protein [Rhizobium sp. TH2]UVC12622.1 hypothetical protein IHQ71_31635 [Rhizobium sp. TH2]